MNIKYFDNAATTKISNEVLNEMFPYFSDIYYNASSIYPGGKLAKEGIELARIRVAKVINAKPEEIYFTSGGSESDNLAIKGIVVASRNRGRHIITSKIEHPAVLNTCKTLEKVGYRVTYLDVDSNGIINIDNLKRNIRRDTILISIMSANNEIGTIQPLEEIGEIARRNNIIFHTDSVQAIGNMKIDVNKFKIDSLSISGHKFYGPKGVGVLYVRNGINFTRQIDGGHQEKDKRAGTENVAGIVGLGKAIELAYENFDEYNNKLLSLREYYISEVQKNIPDIKLNGHKTKRLPGNANISFKNVDGGDLLLKLDEKGICTSAGSACNSASSEPSHVLTAIGLKPEYLQGSLRTTFGAENTKEDIDYLVENLKRIMEECRK